MPIKYEVHDNGRFIHAEAHGIVTDADFIEYETAHISNARIKPPVDELLEITPNAVIQLTQQGIQEALKKSKEPGKQRIPHRYAIVVKSPEKVAWDLAKFYESMAQLHSPSSVIVFASSDIARVWLGREK